MYAALIRAAERWRGLRMTRFDLRRLKAIRDELDRAHAERTRSDRQRIPNPFTQQASDLTQFCEKARQYL